MSAVIFDCETTGFTEPALVETCVLMINGSPHDLERDGEFAYFESFDRHWNPGKPIEYGAMATHHLMLSDVAHAPPASEFSLPSGTEYLIGHNIDFDWKVIGCPPVKRIDTFALARSIFPGFDSHSLWACMYAIYPEYARKHARNAHRAHADALACEHLLHSILTRVWCLELPQTWEDVWQASEKARIPTVMPFGKHRGELIKDVPKQYKAWALREMKDLDEYLRAALMKVDDKVSLFPEAYRFYVHITDEDGICSVVALNLPGVGSCGSTEMEAIANFAEAATGVLSAYEKAGKGIPWKTDELDTSEPGKYKWIKVHA